MPAPRPSRAALALSTLLVGCTAVGPDYVPPQAALPETWHENRTSGLVEGPVDDAAWWRRFDDPTLADLVERALLQNLDLRRSLARLQAARALRGQAEAEAWPRVDARAAYEHRRESANTPLGEFIPRTDISSAGFDAVWELDLWGRVRRSVEAATGEIEASEAEVRGAALSVAAEVALSYVDLRAVERRLAIARDNLALQERTLALVQARAAAGLVVERDVAQALTNVDQTRSRLPAFETAVRAASNRLAVLLGQAPGTLQVAAVERPRVPRAPDRIAVGAPVDLLRRRPDVRAAERRFAAEVARIGIAEADRYPRFSLSGTFGLASDGLDDFTDADSRVLGFGPSVRWNLFDAGRLRQRVRELEANAEAAQIAWEQTVLLAIEETENAMTRFVREQERRDALGRAAAQARRAVELAQAQYREGLSDFQSVLDSERIVATVEDDLATSDAAVTSHLIALYKALGGGFEPPAPVAAGG
ncbi:MAG: efflux transporter outer membrane subunit [Planctomycetes bacterium]|nr:efflux transporter outer membrane subunit [Planctomycetota bacterium]